jgi:hypothetical protein
MIDIVLAWKRLVAKTERPRSPMAARGVTPAGRGVSPSRRHDAGSHSVDRIVRLYLFLMVPTL